MAFELRDYMETADGSRPTACSPPERDISATPISAFSVLRGDDVFDAAHSKTYDALAAQACERLTVHTATASEKICDLVRKQILEMLRHHEGLARRVQAVRPVRIDVLTEHDDASQLGLPPNLSTAVSGLFWMAPDWDQARVMVRAERVSPESTVVFHEIAHAIHYLAFSKEERDLIYRALQHTFGSRDAMDEVFAIYSEREFGKDFTHHEMKAPHVYGWARRQWSEDHVFTRFVRKLYFPHKPLAGPKMAGGDWMTRLAR